MMYDVNACDINSLCVYACFRSFQSNNPGLRQSSDVVEKCMSVLKSRLPSGQGTGGGAGDSAAVLLNRLSSMQQRRAAESYAIISQVCY